VGVVARVMRKKQGGRGGILGIFGDTTWKRGNRRVYSCVYEGEWRWWRDSPGTTEKTMTLNRGQLSKRMMSTWCSAPAVSMFAGNVNVVVKHSSIRNYKNDNGPPG
jgi:hypothetical protein